MAQTPSPLHANLMTDVWELASRKAALAAQLAEIDQLHREAVTLAHAFGIKQPVLAKLSDVTPGRISQIVLSTETPDADPDEFHSAVFKALEWGDDHRERIQRAIAKANPEAFVEKFELVHGRSPASRRPARP
ncbi:hypothetical protein ITJ64_05035 [Herbiconiux sp. VKM Ac-1786]|uniref:hypothetical protein n=1 Tax=Herbiconiux sp. VKM Ac-1786 TaxID=2783824 RepID=UPI00188AB838|nr:hypothetical protein [Herbiconiux sp. VKM Ac-1786]MBF4571874.1 hypothetical protein [Herbiconiux sp. VKM Ac-1786]